MPISLKEDFTVKELIPIKLLLFLQAAGDMALYPFFTLHMKSLGITLSEIGIQFAVTPIATLIATPLVGLLADRLGNFKHMLSVSLILCAIMANFILLVPKVQKVAECELRGDQAMFTCPVERKSDHINVYFEREHFRDNLFKLLLPKCMAKTKVNLTDEEKPLSKPLNSFTLTDCYVECDKATNGTYRYCLENKNRPRRCFDVGSNLLKGKERFIVSLSANSEHVNEPNETNEIEVSLHEILAWNKFYQNITCTGDANNCFIKCPVKSTTRLGLNYSQRLVDDPASRRKTFWMYLFLRIALIVVIATEMSLLKAAILTIVDKCNSEYGFQRLWSMLAACVVPPLTGILMDRLIAGGDADAFSPCFYVYSGFKIFMAIVSMFMDLNIKAPSLKIWEKVGALVRNKEVAVLLLFVTFIGSTWGFIETFIVWYLQDLGASRTLIGFSFTIAAVSGIPFTIFAGAIERKIGHIPILIIGLTVYGVRLIGYSFSSTAYQVLLFETLEGITTSLVVVTITTYSTVLSTHELVATMQATWASLHYAVGRALGSGIGGFLIENLGSKYAYQLYAGSCFMAAAIYLGLYLCWLNRLERGRRQVLEKQSDTSSKPHVEKEATQRRDSIKLSSKSTKKGGADNPSFVKSD